jgi:signal transduction histidine kinase
VRSRLVVALTVPIVVVYLVLGAAYARSLAHSAHLELFLDRLSDASLFVTSARAAFGGGDPVALRSELQRYGEVYDIEAAVLDRHGEVIVGNGFDPDALSDVSRAEVDAALAGRSSGMSPLAVFYDRRLVIAEPVSESGDIVGAVVTVSDTGPLAQEILQWWLLLLGVGVAALAVSVLLVAKVASWILLPVQRVDRAMTEMLHGHMGTRVSEVSGPPELQRVVSVFNGMAEEVERLIQQQEEFVANASHELRNPLNALMLRVEHLGQGLPDGWENELELAREEGQRMTRILEALLMLAHGNQPDATEPFELTRLVEHRLQAWQPVAREQQVSLSATAARRTWCRVDETMLEAAFDAVLDNALKFSPPGSRVEVVVRTQDDVAEIAVHDQGPGLEPHEVGLVTSRFWRSPSNQNRSGSGLGLAIATEFLASCGGELSVACGDGRGLVVTLGIPEDQSPTARSDRDRKCVDGRRARRRPVRQVRT